MEQSEMQSNDVSSIEEYYVRLLHCPNAILEMLRSQVRKSLPVIATQYKTQQLYPCIQTVGAKSVRCMVCRTGIQPLQMLEVFYQIDRQIQNIRAG